MKKYYNGKVKVRSRTCAFHTKHPGKPYAGCTCIKNLPVKSK